ncbi:MAG: Xylose isomerase domain protein barrel, partial [Verrucomicrobiales bacterium]|nr:Xylose isomerase domain protein barrel [Verrucomicrobiales bacterium]
MSLLQSRRNFLRSSALATTAVAFGSVVESQAMEKLARKGEPRLLLSLAAYSFRDYFKDSTSKPNPAIPESKKIDLFDFIDYCGANGCIGAELTS